MERNRTRPKSLLAWWALAALIGLFGGGCALGRVNGGYVRGIIPGDRELREMATDEAAQLSASDRSHFENLFTVAARTHHVCDDHASFNDCWQRWRAMVSEPAMRAFDRTVCALACGDTSPHLLACIDNQVPRLQPTIGTSITCQQAVHDALRNSRDESRAAATALLRTEEDGRSARTELAQRLQELRTAAEARLAAERARDEAQQRAAALEQQLAAARAATATGGGHGGELETNPAPRRRRTRRIVATARALAPASDTERAPRRATQPLPTPHIWRTPPPGFITGFPGAPEVACRIPTNGETRCVSIGPHGVEQMARLTDIAGVTPQRRLAMNVNRLSRRWRRGDMPSRVAALLRNNPQPWGPFVVACLATNQPTLGRPPVYVSSRWGRRPGNAVANMTFDEFNTRRASTRCRTGSITLHVTGQAVRIVLDPQVEPTWNYSPTALGPTASETRRATIQRNQHPQIAAARIVAERNAPLTRPLTQQRLIALRAEVTAPMGKTARVVAWRRPAFAVYWDRWRRLPPCAWV